MEILQTSSSSLAVISATLLVIFYNNKFQLRKRKRMREKRNLTIESGVGALKNKLIFSASS